MPRIQGIYTITNIVAAETYIGSSTDIAQRWSDQRWSDHRWLLKTKRHKNSIFQAAYEMHGIGAFRLLFLSLWSRPNNSCSGSSST